MSIKAMQWAWNVPLSSNLKLILMALADNADDEGICWPRVNTIAKKCSVAPRTVQRAIKTLQSLDLLGKSPRFDKESGRQTSNVYQLRITTPHVNKSPPPPKGGPAGDGDVTLPPSTTSPADDTGDTPKEPSTDNKFNTPLQPRALANTLPPAVAAGKGAFGALCWPTKLSPTHRSTITTMMSGLDQTMAQELLDELSGALSARSIKTDPVRWSRAVIERIHRGRFTPTIGLAVAERRRTSCEPDDIHIKKPATPTRPSDVSTKILGLRQAMRAKK